MKRMVVIAAARRNGDALVVLVGPVEYQAGRFVGPPMAELADGQEVAEAAVGLLGQIGLRMDTDDVAPWGVVSGSAGEYVVVRCQTCHGDLRHPQQWLPLAETLPMMPDFMQRWAYAAWKNKVVPLAELRGASIRYAPIVPLVGPPIERVPA